MTGFRVGLWLIQDPMISQLNGEVDFEDGLRIGAHARIAVLAESVVRSRDFPVPGWWLHDLGVHPSDHGDFKVEACAGGEARVEALFLSHCHSFYEEARRRTLSAGHIMRGSSRAIFGGNGSSHGDTCFAISTR